MLVSLAVVSCELAFLQCSKVMLSRRGGVGESSVRSSMHVPGMVRVCHAELCDFMAWICVGGCMRVLFDVSTWPLTSDRHVFVIVNLLLQE